jgi:hypothetical protein
MNENWIKSLKPGDKVLRDAGFGGKSLVVVKKILPSGRIRFAENDEMMSEFGKHICKERFCSVTFLEWNDENKRIVELSGARRFLSDIKWSEIPDEVILEIQKRIKSMLPIKKV